MTGRSFALTCLLAAALLFGASPAGAQTVEELLDKINRLPAAERQQRLTDGARKEGELVWYSTMNRENSQELINLFQKDHPYVRVKLLNGSAVQTMTRVSSEYNARSYLFDITHIRGLFLTPLRKRQIIAAYRSPFRDALRPGYKDNDGYFNSIFTQGQLFLANRNLLKPQDYPKSIEDLLAPRWKGQLGMDDESYDWIAALMDYYGEERGKQIADQLGRQQLNLRKGNTLLGQLVAAGEIPLMVDGYNHTGYLLKSKGAPIEMLFPEPYVVAKTPTGVWIGARAPHPHSAALFVDFLLSKRGQEVMAAQGRWVSRQDVKYLVDPGTRRVQTVSPIKWGERATELVELFDKLILRKGT
ncbi:MAG TPA: extracellular solute-binding protein [Candidatus Binatia bacterium]|nr:extracellular solute-binding protein [Candidatus Binatia bacterium]